MAYAVIEVVYNIYNVTYIDILNIDTYKQYLLINILLNNSLYNKNKPKVICIIKRWHLIKIACINNPYFIVSIREWMDNSDFWL